VLFAVLLGGLAGGCPPAGGPGGTVRADRKPAKAVAKPEASKADLYSVAGMSAAMDELDAASGTAALAPLAAGYEKAFKTDPKNPFKRFLWAYGLADRNQAWQELAKVTKLNSSFYWAYLGMGVILDGWKVYDQAGQNFERALELGPGIAIGFGRYGRMLLHKGDFAKAIELLAKAVELDAEHVAYRLDLARAQAGAGKPAEARKTYEQAIVQLPGSFDAQAEYARLLAKLGQTEAAVEAFAKAAELDQSDYEVRFLRAGLLDKLGEANQALEAYQQACARKPDELACWQALGEAAGRLGNRDVQIKANEQVIRIDEENLAAHRFLGPVYLAAGAIEKALPSYQLVLAKEPKNVDALLGLAKIYEKGEEWTKALEFDRRVLAVQPDDAEAKAAQQRLFERFHILPEPITGKSPEQVFSANRRQIAAIYKLRLKKHPGLHGDLLIKVAVDNDGKVQDVTVAKNTVGDQVLELCAIWNLQRSSFPSGFGATYDFALTLKPGES